MSRESRFPELTPDVQEQLEAFIERDEKIARWLSLLTIPAILLVWIIGGIVLLS